MRIGKVIEAGNREPPAVEVPAPNKEVERLLNLLETVGDSVDGLSDEEVAELLK